MNSRTLVLVVVLGVIAIAVGWVYESRLQPDRSQAEMVIPDNIDYFLTDLNYRVMNDEGILDFEIDSPRLEHYPRTDISSIEIPSMQIYRQSDRWQVDALNGEFEHDRNLLRLQSQVVMKRLGDKPMQIYTESIRFEPDLDLVSSESSITMHSDGATIDAENATFDLAAKVYRFKQTRAVYQNNDS